MVRMSPGGVARIACLALVLGLLPRLLHGQPAQEPVLALRGGTLIDGNGGPPVANATVLVQGDHITAVGPAAQIRIPDHATVIDASGKFILPGLWDFQVNYSWFWGELFLHQGVTSTVDIGNGEEVSIAHRNAVTQGKILGPRTFIGVGHVGGARPDQLTGWETALSTRQIPKSAEDAAAVARRWLTAGADAVMFHNGSFPREFYAAAFDEAHRAGKPAFCRCGGPVMTPKDGALVGADVFPHSTGIPAAVARDGAKGSELDLYAAMDDAKAKALIALLVEHKVYLVPTIVHLSPSYPKGWTRFKDETDKVFADPALLSYYDPGFLADMRATYSRWDKGEVRARRTIGYQNMLRWNRMYDAAGGRVLVAGDTNSAKAPGLIVHDEMEAFEEAGIPRMHVIQGATKWPAEAMRVADRLGTIEPGKLADILVVDADPLQDIANLRKISTVIANGKRVERVFHSAYTTPFTASRDNVAVVESLEWVRALKQANFGGGLAGGFGFGGPPPGGEEEDPPQSPQPAIETIFPYGVAQGAATTTVTVRGFNFLRHRSRVLFDGRSVPFTRVSPTELRVALGADLLTRPGRFDLTVQNAEPRATRPWGNGTSNVAHFIVDFRYPQETVP
jgi:imidazolonepropionase-like amidohydrolase